MRATGDDFVLFDRSKIIGIKRIGHDLVGPALFLNHSSHADIAIVHLELLRFVDVADDLGGLDDVFQQVADAVTISGPGQVRAHAAADIVKSVASDAGGGREHGLATGEVLAAQFSGEQGGGIVDRVNLSGTFGGHRPGHKQMHRGLGDIGHDIALAGVGYLVQRIFADVGDETGETGAASPLASRGEPREIGSAQLGGPTDGCISQGVGEGDLLPVGSAVRGALDRGSVAIITGDEAGAAELFGGGFLWFGDEE